MVQAFTRLAQKKIDMEIEIIPSRITFDHHNQDLPYKFKLKINRGPFTFESKVYELDLILNIPVLSDYLGTHGAIFVMPMAFIEYFFNITDSQKYYFLPHYINHLM